MLRKHVVIVGGGWAGVTLARKLKKIPKDKVRITLVSDQQNFRYSAALYRVATGYREKEAIIPISELTEDIESLKFIKAKTTHINRSKKTIALEGGQELHYDIAIFALGNVTNYFNIPGLKELSYGIKSSHELHHFRAHLHHELIDENSPDKNYVIVGAGPTGVELSAALASYLRRVAKRHSLRKKSISIELVEASNRVLPLSSSNVSRKVLDRLHKLGIKVHLKAKVGLETTDSLQYNGRSIPTHTVVWTAGTSNNPFYKNNHTQFSLNEKGKVIVDDRLQVDRYTYVIGDNADTPYSGLGLTAVHNAKYVAKDIAKRIDGQLRTPIYRPLVPATVIPVGKSWAIFQYRGFVISGLLGGLIRIMADLTAYHDIAGWFNGTRYWLKSGNKEERCQICKIAIKQEDWITQSSYR